MIFFLIVSISVGHGKVFHQLLEGEEGESNCVPQLVIGLSDPLRLAVSG